MRDERLADLNFRQLLHYDGGGPPVQHSFDTPLACSGYCVHCEERGNVFHNAGDSFDQMSHGCDTSVYEKLLGGPIPNREGRLEVPIIFLLENPGGDRGIGEPVKFRGCKKRPPVNHYYWTPSVSTWPSTWPLDNEKNIYGDYFAYLMNKHRLSNVYITNLIKCNVSKEKSDYNYNESRSNCVERWFRREMKIFSPKFVFSFGIKATNGFKEHNWNIPSLRLYHPAQRSCTRREMVSRNDSNIEHFLRNHL